MFIARTPATRSGTVGEAETQVVVYSTSFIPPLRTVLPFGHVFESINTALLRSETPFTWISVVAVALRVLIVKTSFTDSMS